MEKEDTVSVQWAQEDVETSYSLVNNIIIIIIIIIIIMRVKCLFADVWRECSL
jgi:hypothetical protein